MNTMDDFYDLQLKFNVLLLAYVFKTFRKVSITFLELDPDSNLPTICLQLGSHTKDCKDFLRPNLKLIFYNGQYQFVENTVKTGISMICKGYTDARNQFIKMYNASKPTLYII